MPQRNRVARVSGLNNNFPGQLPAPSSYYTADGAPGLTAGPTTGFSVAIGLRLPILIGGDVLGTPWIDPVSEAEGYLDPIDALPVVGCRFR